MTIDVNGTTLAYNVQGAGRPIVLVHGFPLDSRIWVATAAILARSMRVFCLDLRGFGESAPVDSFSMRDLANDVAEAAEKLKIAPCPMAGLSMGGYVLQTLAKYRPEAISHLILVDTKAEADSAEGRAKREAMARDALQKGTKAVADAMAPNMLGAAPDPAVVGELRTIMESQRPETLAAASLAMRDREDFTPFLPTLRIPLRLIYGTQDTISPLSIGQAIQQRVPGSQLFPIDNAGHLAPMEQPEAVADAILRSV